MRLISITAVAVVFFMISCQNAEKGETLTTQEELLHDSLQRSASIPPSTIDYSSLKSAGVNKALYATAYAQSTFPGYSPTKANDGSTNVSVGGSYSWANGHIYTTDGKIPQWFDLRFDSTITFTQINLFTTQNYEMKQFKVLINDNGVWDTISSVYNNTSTLVSMQYDTAYTADTIRIWCERGPDNQYVYTRINEIQVY